MDIKESEKLKETICELIRKSNSWDKINNFFTKNKKIKPYYDVACSEAFDCQNFGTATIYILTIEKLLEKIENGD